jgi:pSer/pThr/pTyr-binding forkhead associated (FHA) protein
MEMPLPEEEDIQYKLDEIPPLDLPLPEFDEKEIIGEIDVYVNKEKVATHEIESPTKIGRDPAQSDIIITELIVSKLHCTIYVKESSVFVQDNNSTNGTYVYNQKISLQPIEDNTIIGLGKKGTVQIIFRKGGQE